ncbi:MAG TPA: hypothetical protein VI320_27590 [Terracidiphilus sp.]|jgi:hypothetical protein
MTQFDHFRRIRFWLGVFIAGLVFSGLTALPLESELSWLSSTLHQSWMRPIAESTQLLPWIERVYDALRTTEASYPFLAYGTDWLAFAHLVIAIAFVGPYIDPVGNKWLITWGLIACAGVIPLALIAGPIRGIPFPWRLIDCSFGIMGSVPLLLSRRSIRMLEIEREQA